MRRRFAYALVFALCLGTRLAAPQAAIDLVWEDLPPLPDTQGFGGPFAGVHNGALIIAGGANFPEAPPWEGGAKVWYPDVYLLPSPESAEWRKHPALDIPLAYGGSISAESGLLLLGGSNGEGVDRGIRRLEWRAETRSFLSMDNAPLLPAPSTYHAAARIGDVAYVVAGQSTLDATTLQHKFWALDLEKNRWRELPPWPGRARIKSVVAVEENAEGQSCLYLFSGEIPERGEDGEVGLTYVTDAYRFNPATESWAPIADVPRPIAAGSAIGIGRNTILCFSGSTGAHVTKPVQDRPEFPTDIYAYDTKTDSWSIAGHMPRSVVTTNAVRWGDRIVITSGEIRPGVRTPRVQSLRIEWK